MRLNDLLPHSPSLPIDEPGYPLEKTQAGATRHTRVAGQRPEATTHAGHSPKCPALSALAMNPSGKRIWPQSACLCLHPPELMTRNACRASRIPTAHEARQL
jgi:hypothetical protein